MSTDLLQGIFNVITQIQLQWLPGHKTPTKLHLSCFTGVAALEVLLLKHGHSFQSSYKNCVLLIFRVASLKHFMAVFPLRY